MSTLYCVTFNYGGKMWYAVNEKRRFGDRLPTGVLSPEKRCAMDKKKAVDLLEFMRKQSTFDGVALRKLVIPTK